MPDPADYEARVSLRASAPDRAPVIGCLSEGGLYVLGALGARGLTFAPLLGDLLAAHIMALPMVLDRRIWQALDPFRFRLRKGRR
jgi:tRNA 5-methylaminomethyl-2-thiouridine biosynthesis bifunctional protein